MVTSSEFVLNIPASFFCWASSKPSILVSMSSACSAILKVKPLPPSQCTYFPACPRFTEFSYARDHFSVLRIFPLRVTTIWLCAQWKPPEPGYRSVLPVRVTTNSGLRTSSMHVLNLTLSAAALRPVPGSQLTAQKSSNGLCASSSKAAKYRLAW